MLINEIVRNESVLFTKGIFDGEHGTFKRIVEFIDGCSYVCEIYIAGEFREFTSDFFKFDNPEIQEEWDWSKNIFR